MFPPIGSSCFDVFDYSLQGFYSLFKFSLIYYKLYSKIFININFKVC